MKILIISDSHGNIANLKHVLGFAKKVGVKAVIHCGDWDNVDACETVFSFGIPVYTVLGNADVSLDVEEYLKFNAKRFDPDFLKVELGGRKIGITHRLRVDDNRVEGCHIIFSGHYHSAEQKIVDFRKLVRPGALITDINFAIYETETNEVQFIGAEMFKNVKI